MLNMMSCMYLALCMKFNEFKREERGAVDIVAIVVMIGIAVILAVLFRNQVTQLLESLFGTITQNAQDAVGGGEG